MLCLPALVLDRFGALLGLSRRLKRFVLQEAIRMGGRAMHWNNIGLGHYLDRVLVYMVATETECSWRGNSVTTTIGVVHRSNHNKL